MEYLGFWVTCDGVKPIDKNTSNKNMTPPTSRKVTSVYGCSELLSQYVGNILKHVSSFK